MRRHEHLRHGKYAANIECTPALQAGPRANLDEFVDAMKRLDQSITFFEQHECVLLNAITSDPF